MELTIPTQVVDDFGRATENLKLSNERRKEYRTLFLESAKLGNKEWSGQLFEVRMDEHDKQRLVKPLLRQHLLKRLTPEEVDHIFQASTVTSEEWHFTAHRIPTGE
jgi:vacuolar-type H+-ATPase subunit E/Vma4